jgi:hypothetical protein
MAAKGSGSVKVAVLQEQGNAAQSADMGMGSASVVYES